MAQINNAPVNTQTVAGNANVTTDALINKLQGQAAQLQVTANSAPVLVLNGRAVPLPNNSAIPRNLPASTPVEINLKEQGSSTVIELNRPGPMAQSIQLTPGQSLQLLQALSANPRMLTDISPKDVNAKALQVRGDTVVLQVSGKAMSFKVPNASAKFREGQTVTLKLVHSEAQWQANIKGADTSASGKSSQGQPSQGMNNVNNARATPNANHTPALLASSLPKNTPLSLDAGDKAALLNLQRLLPQGLQNAITGQTSPTLLIDKNQQLKLQWTQTNQLIARLPIDNELKPKLAELASQLQTGNTTNTSNSAMPALPLAASTANASLHSTQQLSTQLSAQMVSQLTSGLPNSPITIQEGLKILAQLPPAPDFKSNDIKPDNQRSNQDPSKSTQSSSDAPKENASKTPDTTNKSTNSKETLPADAVKATDADIAQLRKIVRDAVLQQTDKSGLSAQLQPLLRALQARMDSPSAAVAAIMTAIKNLQNADDGPITQYLSELSKLLGGEANTKSNNELTTPSPQELKQLLTSSPLPVSSQSLNQISASPGNQSSMITGLMGMIQVSLAARLARKQPEQLERLAQLLSPAAAVASGIKTTNNGANSKAQANKSLSDILSLDGKHQLLKNLDKLVSSHQFNRLSNMESQLSGQEGIYYVLPLSDNQQRKDAELLIKREPEPEDQKEQKKSNGNYWALTMKLPIGETGEILAKAKISGSVVELDFYTSNQQTKELVFNFMPLLKRRFKQLGIEMDKCQCQLGRIPEALKQRPYSVFEAKA